jgi:cell division protein FtsQ
MYRALAARLPLPTRTGRSWPGLRAPRAALERAWGERRTRVALVCVILAVPALLGGWMWFRKSSFVAVHTVNVSGVQGPQAAAIESALRSAGRSMSTLDVNLAALRSAVAPFVVVREVRASGSFPHTLDVRVIEQLPVAALLSGGARTAVAADGVVLGPGLLSPGLPTVAAQVSPADGQTVKEGDVRAALEVLGAAPSSLAAQVASAFTGKEGLTLAMRNGLHVVFGDGTRAHAKWQALETVLIDEGSSGASYIDVRLPERPAAGGYPEGVAPLAHASAGEATGAAAPGSSVEALAEALRSSTGVASGAPATGSEHPERSSEHSGEHESTRSTGGESASTPPATGGEEAASQAPARSAPSAGEAAQASGGAGAPEAGG